MILITGAAGFIGAHVLGHLAASGKSAVGIDSFNDYYDVSLKRDRVKALVTPYGAEVLEVDCSDAAALGRIFDGHGITRVIHLAAQAGVRYSLENPEAYIASNLSGFANVLERCRRSKVQHLVYASSSSVYGSNTSLPWDENDSVTHPISLYAATKASNELLAHSYSHLFRLPVSGVRLFTVYGPWGRPDMAPFIFSRAIASGQPIRVFNLGDMRRDFTYVDDVVQAICRLVDKPATPDDSYDRKSPANATSDAPYRIFNVGNHRAEGLLDFIELLERAMGKTAIRELAPMQPGDVQATYAANARISEWIDFKPSTPLSEGVSRFAQWYGAYYPELIDSHPKV